MFDQAYQGSETKKPPKTFETAKVLLRYPNKKIRLFLGLHEKNQTGFQSIKKTVWPTFDVFGNIRSLVASSRLASYKENGR